VPVATDPVGTQAYGAPGSVGTLPPPGVQPGAIQGNQPTPTPTPTSTGSNTYPNQLVQQLLSVIMPGLTAQGAQMQGLWNQAALTPVQAGATEWNAQQQAGFQQAQNLLQGQNITGQQQLLGNTGNYQTGLTGNLGSFLQNPTQQGLLGMQQYIAGQENQIATAQLPGQYAARGAIGTTGMHQAQQLQALGWQGQQAQFGYSEASLQNQTKALDRAATANGISSEQIQVSLQNMLDQTGLSSLMTINDIAQEMATVQAGGFSSILQAVAPLGQIAGLQLSLGGK
jgi:hypothetical protein